MNEQSPTKEIWKQVPGYEDSYHVSNLGRVRSLARVSKKGWTCKERIMRTSLVGPKHCRYLAVNLAGCGKARKFTVHKLVLMAFIGPRPSGMESCHYPDKDRTNNRLDNLRWDTSKENALDRSKHGTQARGERQGQSKLTESDVRMIRQLALKSSQHELSMIFGVGQGQISNIVRRKAWKHIGGESHQLIAQCDVCGADYRKWKRNMRYCSNSCRWRGTYQKH